MNLLWNEQFFNLWLQDIIFRHHFSVEITLREPINILPLHWNNVKLTLWNLILNQISRFIKPEKIYYSRGHFFGSKYPIYRIYFFLFKKTETLSLKPIYCFKLNEKRNPSTNLLFSHDPFMKVMAFRNGVCSIPVGGNGPLISGWNRAKEEEPDKILGSNWGLMMNWESATLR